MSMLLSVLSFIAIFFLVLFSVLFLRKNSYSIRNTQERRICILIVCVVLTVKSVYALWQGFAEELIEFYITAAILSGILFVSYGIILKIKKQEE